LDLIVNNSKVLRQFTEERFNYIDNMNDAELEKFLN